MLDLAKTLDKHYLLSRYPNGFDAGAPTDFYTRPKAEQALATAEQILAFCRRRGQVLHCDIGHRDA